MRRIFFLWNVICLVLLVTTGCANGAVAGASQNMVNYANREHSAIQVNRNTRFKAVVDELRREKKGNEEEKTREVLAAITSEPDATPATVLNLTWGEAARLQNKFVEIDADMDSWVTDEAVDTAAADEVVGVFNDVHDLWLERDRRMAAAQAAAIARLSKGVPLVLDAVNQRAAQKEKEKEDDVEDVAEDLEEEPAAEVKIPAALPASPTEAPATSARLRVAPRR